MKKIIVCIHIIALLAGVVRVCTIPMENKLRWSMGYVVPWVLFLSAFAVSCLLPKMKRFRKILKAYIIIFWSLPVVACYCMGFYAFYFPWFCASLFIPNATLIENEHYIIQKCAPTDG